MALKITDDCINCDACIQECPNTAIYEPNEKWTYADGTSLTGMIQTLNGENKSASQEYTPISEDFYFIVEDKCTECKGFHEEPQCASVCPVDCIIIDADLDESEEQLYAKKNWMHES